MNKNMSSKIWNIDEIEYLKNNYASINNRDLSLIMNRSIRSVKCKANKLKLLKTSKELNIDEKNFLINNYYNKSNEELAIIMNRSIDNIRYYAKILNLKKSKEHKSKMIGKRNKMVGRDLSKENLIKIAKQYKTRGEFQEKDSSAYTTARINFGLDIICSHMLKQTTIIIT